MGFLRHAVVPKKKSSWCPNQNRDLALGGLCFESEAYLFEIIKNYSREIGMSLSNEDMKVEKIENRKVILVFPPFLKINVGSGGIRTYVSEETGALNQRLRPLGHATAKMP